MRLAQARKDVSQIFNSLLRRQIGQRWPTVEYLGSKDDVVFAALQGYDNPEVALNTGMILREMLRHESLAKILLYSDQCVEPFPVEQDWLSIACLACTTLLGTSSRLRSG
jgi:calcium binding protein 39